MPRKIPGIDRAIQGKAFSKGLHLGGAAKGTVKEDPRKGQSNHRREYTGIRPARNYEMRSERWAGSKRISRHSPRLSSVKRAVSMPSNCSRGLSGNASRKAAWNMAL